MLYFYLISALLALTIKLFVVVFVRRAGIRTEHLFAFIAVFALHNATEFFMLLDFMKPVANEEFMRLYYCITMVLVGYACSFGIEISGIRKSSPIFRNIETGVWTVIALSIIVLLFSDSLVAGMAPVGVLYTAIRGPLYLIFPTVSAVALVTCLAALTIGYKYSDDKRQKARCKNMILSFTPVVAAALTVLVLMQMNLNINATAVLPLASAIFICLLAYSEKSHGLTSIRKHIPNTKENEISTDVQEVFYAYSEGDLSLQDSMDKIEFLMVNYAFQKTDYNVLQTAKHMQVARSTLYDKLAKHGLSTKNKPVPSE